MLPCVFRPLTGVVHQWTTVQCAHFHKGKTDRTTWKRRKANEIVGCGDMQQTIWQSVICCFYQLNSIGQRAERENMFSLLLSSGRWLLAKVENVNIVVKVKLFHFCFSSCVGQQRATIFVFGKTRTNSWPMGANRSSQWTRSSSQRSYTARAANCWFEWASSSNFYWRVSVEWLCQCSSVGTSTVLLFASSLKQQSPIAVLLLFDCQIHQSSSIEESWTTIVEQRRLFNWLREWARHQHQRRRTLLAP